MIQLDRVGEEIVKNNYWNDIYWKKHLDDHKGEDLDFLSDLWIEKYADIFDKIPRGDALDLGCGLGQYTQYLMNNGFEVTSADISEEVLGRLKSSIAGVNIKQLDMSKPLPFEDNSFDLVFANLSIHYFDKKTTVNLLKEIRRILKDGGYFIGSVNSSKTFKFIKEHAKEIEENYYYERGRMVRLWNKEQFDYFFKDFELVILEEVETTRWNRTKIMWEFIAKK